MLPQSLVRQQLPCYLIERRAEPNAGTWMACSVPACCLLDMPNGVCGALLGISALLHTEKLLMGRVARPPSRSFRAARCSS